MQTSEIQNIKSRYKVIGNADGLNRALDVAIQVAPTELSVLIVGESGVGKEVIPRIIHDNSARKHNKYIAINCGSIPEGTIDSELFGHAMGAFTGAVGEREGYFGAANKGTLFLDEVGELPMATQARLLRVLETGEYIRVGESEVRKTDVRIVAATNVNIQKAIREGRFREDLYYRLNTIPIKLPSLRERGRDVVLLFKYFANQVAQDYHREPLRLDQDAENLLMAYKWPGNIRQLRNLTEQMSILNKENILTADILKEYITDDTDQTTIPVIVRQPSFNNDSNHVNGGYYDNNVILTLASKINELQHEVEDLKKQVGNGGNASSVQTLINHGNEQSHIIAAPGDSNGNMKITMNSNAISANGYITQADELEDVIDYNEQPKKMKDMEKQAILEALERNKNNRNKTAKELGLSVRTLYRKLVIYGISK